MRSIIDGVSFDDYIKYYYCRNKHDARLQKLAAPMHAFSCHFYTALCEKEQGYRRAAAMSKTVDIFKMDYLFIPVNKADHWSLLCIVRPGAVIMQVHILQYVKFLN